MKNKKNHPPNEYAVTEFRSYRLPDYFPVLLLTGEHWKISDIPSGRLHFHNCLEVGICHSYSGQIGFYGEALPFAEGDMTCIPKNIPHTTYSDQGRRSTWSYIFFDPGRLFGQMLPGPWEDLHLLAGQCDSFQYLLKKEEYPKERELISQIILEMTQEKPGFQISTRGLLLSLYIQLYRIQSSRIARHASRNEEEGSMKTLVLAPALEFIDAHYMENFTMETLADICHFSPTHFRRVFSQVMGMPPLEYVNRIRIAEACNRLCTTEEPILSISENTGFGSVSSFNRNFRQSVKMTPGEYRRKTADTVLEFNGWMAPEDIGKP